MCHRISLFTTFFRSCVFVVVVSSIAHLFPFNAHFSRQPWNNAVVIYTQTHSGSEATPSLVYFKARARRKQRYSSYRKRTWLWCEGVIDNKGYRELHILSVRTQIYVLNNSQKRSFDWIPIVWPWQDQRHERNHWTFSPSRCLVRENMSSTCCGSKKQRMNNSTCNHTPSSSNHAKMNGHSSSSTQNNVGNHNHATNHNGVCSNGYGDVEQVANAEMCFFCFEVLHRELYRLDDMPEANFTNEA